jgi:DNA-binding response OmpR family regulator
MTNSVTPANPTLLMVDDDVDYAALLREAFAPSFYLHCLTSVRSPEMPTDFSPYKAALVDLSLESPDDGEKFLTQLLSKNPGFPCFVLSANESMASRLKHLKNGVRDYLGKTMHPEEMRVRILNSLRLEVRGLSRLLQLADMKLNLTMMELFINGESIEVSRIEFKTLAFLMERNPMPVTKEALYQAVWGRPHIELGTLKTSLSNLNKKIAASELCLRMIDGKISFHPRTTDS